MTRPTIVIVPGAWQTANVWEGFSEVLSDAGYATEYVPLPSVGGAEIPLTGLSEDVAAVQIVLENLRSDGKQALLLCHSSGGLVGSNSVSGFKVAGLVLLSAFMIPSGKSVLDMLGGQPLPWMNIEGDRVTGVRDMLPQVAFNDLGKDEQAKWSQAVTHTSAAVFATPSAFEPWASGVPCGYIFCSDDNALPLPIQQQMAAQLGPDAVSATLQSGHCPFLSVPNQLLDAVQKVEHGLALKAVEA